MKTKLRDYHKSTPPRRIAGGELMVCQSCGSVVTVTPIAIEILLEKSSFHTASVEYRNDDYRIMYILDEVSPCCKNCFVLFPSKRTIQQRTEDKPIFRISKRNVDDLLITAEILHKAGD